MASRSWCWTLFIEQKEDGDFQPQDYIREIRCWRHHRGSIFQLEECQNGRRHLQGYSEFNNPSRFSAFQIGRFQAGHFEKRKGTKSQAVAYCRKVESRLEGPWVVGDMEIQQGTRNDLLVVQSLLQDGASEKTIADDHFGVWVKYHKAFKKYKSLCVEPRNWKTKTYIFWGEAGSGKTRRVYEELREEHGPVYDVPRPNGGSIWFDGYDPAIHKVILFDDFYGWCPLHLLLKLCDRYPMQVPVKGGHVEFCALALVFTSNKPWSDWYKWDEFGSELEKAFERRIDVKEHMIL